MTCKALEGRSEAARCRRKGADPRGGDLVTEDAGLPHDLTAEKIRWIGQINGPVARIVSVAFRRIVRALPIARMGSRFRVAGRIRTVNPIVGLSEER